MSASGQTGQSDAIHSPDACASIVVRLIVAVDGSTAVVWIVAISCRPSVLRTMSRPLESGAYRKLCPASPRHSRMVATRDFSGLVSSSCALASAAASEATDSLDRRMAALRLENIEAHRTGLGALGADPMADRFLGVLRHQT